MENLPISMDSDDRLNNLPDELAPHHPVREGRRKAAHRADQIGPDQQPVPPAHASFQCEALFPEHHQMGEVDFVLMRWRVGTVIEAELAVVAFIDDLAMIGGSQLRHSTVIFIDTVHQRVDGGTEIETAAELVENLI